jgi:hypothetical protein
VQNELVIVSYNFIGSNYILSQANSTLQQSAYMQKRIPRGAPAGILNAKTLAEENLKGFRLKNLQKESDIPLRVNQA